MGELVLWRERRLSEVEVTEIDSVGELLTFGVFSDDREGAAMMKGGGDVETILTTEVPRCTLASLGMNDNAEAKGADGSGVIIEATTEIFPG